MKKCWLPYLLAASSAFAQTYGLTSNWLGNFEIEQPEELSCASMVFARALTINMPETWRNAFKGHRVSYRALYRMAQESRSCATADCLQGNTLAEVLNIVQTYGVPVLPMNADRSYKTYAQTCADLESGSAQFVRFKSYDWLIRDFVDRRDDPVDHAIETLANGEAEAKKPGARRLILGIDATVRVDRSSGTVHSRHTFLVRKSEPRPGATWDFSTWFDTDEYVGPHPILLAGTAFTQFGEPSFMASDSKYSRAGFMERKDFAAWHETGRDIPDAVYVQGFAFAPLKASLQAYRSVCRHGKARAAFDDLDRIIARRHRQALERMRSSDLPMFPGY